MRRIDRDFLGLALPLILQNGLKASFQILDSVLVARIGTTAMAAAGFTHSIMGVFILLILATSAAIQPVVSQALQNPLQKAAGWRLIQICTYCFLLFGLLLIGVGYLNLGRVLEFGELSPKVRLEADRFLSSLLPMIPFMAAALPLEAALRAERHLKADLWIRIVGLVLNTGLSVLLIYGFWGAPKMGIVGAGMATSISKLVELILLMVYSRRLIPASPSLKPKFPKAWLRFIMGSLGTLYVQEISFSFLHVAYMRFFSELGTGSLALWQYVNQLDQLLISVCSALFTAGGILLSKELSTGHFLRSELMAKHLLKRVLWLGVWWILPVCLLLPALESLYDLDSQLIVDARSLGLMFALFIPVRMLTLQLLLGTLRVGGVFMATATGEMITSWFVTVPLMLALSSTRYVDESSLFLLVNGQWCLMLIWFWYLFWRRKWLISL